MNQIAYPIERPASPRREMSTAPRDGSRILVEQARKNSRPDARYEIVPAKWHDNPPGTPVAGYWRLLHSSVAGRQDDELLGWWPIVGGVTTYRVAS
jgi:hypothetical protein